MNTFNAPQDNAHLLDEEDQNDDDYNPLDYFDDLLADGVNNDEKNPIRVSKKEAKDLQKDLLTYFVQDDPCINLSFDMDEDSFYNQELDSSATQLSEIKTESAR